MRKSWFRLCSFLLAIILLFNMLPLQAAAEQRDAGRTEQNSSNTSLSTTNTSSSRIVEEITQKRTEFSKEFLLENGLHMITVYPDAVHYATENGWEEIDNTLTTRTDGTIGNTAGIWDVSFPQQLSKDKSITIKKDGYTLSFFMVGELTGSGNVAVRSTDSAKNASEMLTATSIQQSDATIQMPDLTAMEESAEHEQIVPRKAYAKLTYSNVYNNTDVVYDLSSNKVKESIVLESYNSALRGYRYTLDVGTMIPVLEESGEILFYDSSRENVILVMPAPFMVDNAGTYNDDIQVNLTGSGNKYTLTYLLPQQWLAEEDRAWPVILDPVVQPALTTANIRDRTVVNNGSFAQNWGMNSCGYYANGDITRTYLKYNNLPSLTSSDVIVSATLQMYKPNASSTTTPIYAYKVLGTWESETITWANKPAHGATIEDYAVVHAIGWYCWDITDVVRNWYEEENTGVMFRTSSEIENGGVPNFKEFYSSDFGTEPSRPILSIMFRNNNGLEGYWDYTASSAGRAGSGYINHYTGNLVWVKDDIGFGGNRMPVSVSHIYNANDAYSISDNNNSNDTAGNAFGLGNGWRTNYNQLVYQWSTDSDYYVWEDADGTDHYFEYTSSGTYKDEDGLELILTTTGSGTEKYKITDKNGNISYFDNYGRLSKIQNNQDTKSNITISYNGTTKQISTITDGVGRKYNFAYTSNLLTRISYVGGGTVEISHISFAYSGSNLTTVTHRDGKSVTYTYGANNLLTSAQDIDGYKLTYSYHSAVVGKPARIHTVAETHNGQAGGTLTFTYNHNQTKVQDHSGNAITYQFNNLGNTVSVQDDEGRAQYYKYATEMAQDSATKGNQLRVSSKLQNTVGNMLKDSGFEGSTLWTPTASYVGVSIATSDAYSGSRSMKIVASAPGYGVHENAYAVAAGKTVTFSAYTKTSDATLYLAVFDGSGLVEGTMVAPTGEWTRIELTYTNTSTGPKNIRPYILAATDGTFLVDNVQLEYSATASRYNLIENGDFRYQNSGWSSSTGLGTATPAAPQLDNSIYQMVGSATAQRRINQTVPVKGSAGDSYVLGGWAQGSAAPLWQKDYESNAREFALQLRFNYTDNSQSKTFIAQFNPDYDGWQYAAVAAVAEKAYSSVTVELIYDYNVNVVAFDGIQLFREEFGASYTYDENGNVISVTDLQKQNTTYEYDANNNLTRVIQDGTAKMTYDYDAYHNVTRATSGENLVYNFTYDIFGNNKTVSITVGGSTISASAAYTDDGNRLVSTTDALGKVTTYSYHADTNVLEWVQNPEDTVDTRTNYTYDNMYRLYSTASATDTGGSLSTVYHYTSNNDYLNAIITPTTTYFFNVGNFGLTTSIKANNSFLASYQYTTDGNNYLSQLDYGNGDSVNYSYDKKGRLTLETFEDGDTVSYAYNNNGDLSIVTDSASGITTKYFYDLTDRLVKQEHTGSISHSVQYTYDTLNNLTALKEVISGVTHTTAYAYDDDNRVSSVTNGTIGEHYTYDDFGRVGQTATKNGTANVLTESYTFTAPSGAATSGQIATNHLQAAGYNVTYSYTYDGNGNILSISDGTYTTTYAYDSANQLTRENNQAAGFTHTWEYDSAGNILYRREYAYTTGALGTPTKTVTYSYGGNAWGDMLGGYNYDGISYDQIGNPTADGYYTYTWEHGRELASIRNVMTGETWTYTYDAGGMRTQRTNGGTTYKYIYNGSSLSQMTVGGNTLYFTYGANGAPLTVTYNGTVYYYVTNIQGDVIAILNGAGAPVVNYTYDAWGKSLSTTGSMATTLGTLNPLRYRGYVYDQEHSLYYLQSRYYNPTWGRFINADALVSTGQGPLGNNMFAYCLNNPVNCFDYTGLTTVANKQTDDPFFQLLSLWRECGSSTGTGSATRTIGTVVGAAVVVITTLAKREITTVPKTDEKTEVLSAKSSDDGEAVFFGVDLFGGTMNFVTGPMSFAEADLWATVNAAAGIYPDRAAWGLYTASAEDALLMAIWLQYSVGPIRFDLPKSSRHLPHFHVGDKTVHGIPAENFHIWYGGLS